MYRIEGYVLDLNDVPVPNVPVFICMKDRPLLFTYRHPRYRRYNYIDGNILYLCWNTIHKFNTKTGEFLLSSPVPYTGTVNRIAACPNNIYIGGTSSTGIRRYSKTDLTETGYRYSGVTIRAMAADPDLDYFYYSNTPTSNDRVIRLPYSTFDTLTYGPITTNSKHIDTIASDGTYVYAGTEPDSTDNYTTQLQIIAKDNWSAVHNELPFVFERINSLAVDDDYLYVGCYGLGGNSSHLHIVDTSTHQIVDSTADLGLSVLNVNIDHPDYIILLLGGHYVGKVSRNDLSFSLTRFNKPEASLGLDLVSGDASVGIGDDGFVYVSSRRLTAPNLEANVFTDASGKFFLQHELIQPNFKYSAYISSPPEGEMESIAIAEINFTEV